MNGPETLRRRLDAIERGAHRRRSVHDYTDAELEDLAARARRADELPPAERAAVLAELEAIAPDLERYAAPEGA